MKLSLLLSLSCIEPKFAFPGMDGDRCKCVVRHGLDCSNITNLAAHESALSGSAANKLETVWNLMKANQHHGEYMGTMTTIAKGHDTAFLHSMADNPTEERPADYQKMTHGIGATAKAHFDWQNTKHQYTGMFQKADNCIVRIANAAQPTKADGIVVTSYNPNMAIKCFRDGVHDSANILTIWEIDGYDVIPANNTGSCSFFDTPMSNHCGHRDNITRILADLFIPPFDKIDRRGMMLGLSPMAEMTQDGQEVAKPNFPWLLLFQPDPKLRKVPCHFDNYTSQLRNMRDDWVGKAAFQVYAVHNPWYSRPVGEPSMEHLGSMVFDSPFIESMYGDHQLYFRHRFMYQELDLLKKWDPQREADWAAYTDPDTYIGQAHIKEEGAAWYGPHIPDAPPIYQTCAADVNVGFCIIKGCFGQRGRAYCSGTECLCKPGYCTKSGQKGSCERDPSSSISFEADASSSSAGWLSLGFISAGVSAGMFTMVMNKIGARRSSSLRAPLFA